MMVWPSPITLPATDGVELFIDSPIALVKKNHCIPLVTASGQRGIRAQERTFQGDEVLRGLRCHSEAGSPSSGSSLTLTGLRAERRGRVRLELEPRGLAGL